MTRIFISFMARGSISFFVFIELPPIDSKGGADFVFGRVTVRSEKALFRFLSGSFTYDSSGNNYFSARLWAHGGPMLARQLRVSAPSITGDSRLPRERQPNQKSWDMNETSIDLDEIQGHAVRRPESSGGGMRHQGNMEPASVIRVLVVDDHPIVRLGLIRLIETAWPQAVIDQADSVMQAKLRVAAALPQIITLDLSLPDSEGTEALSHMLRAARDVPILVVSQSKEATHAQRVMQMGAAGYLSKDRTGDELVGAMERILQGGRYVTPDMADRLLAMLEGKSPTALPHEALTTQEYRVMQLIAAGMRASRIAETMHLSVKTVANYRARILEKTGWRNNIELTKYCVQHGLTNSG